MNAASKRKLLWASKKEETAQTEAMKTVWEDSKFTDEKRKEKFLQLMGAKKKKTEEDTYNPDRPTTPERDVDNNTTGDLEQDKLFSTLEKQYAFGVSRKTSGALGLGFN